MIDPDTELLTRGQVATLIGRDRRRVPDWCAARGIPRYRDPNDPHRRWLYPAAPIRAVLAVERRPRPVPEVIRLHRFIRRALIA
ncbi:hypothetical protein [Micromonospora sp. CB01531]|uniref:hypothetical protein n=1 Tax=Micromonospora sp. CB01531 TaxID=1718947 RepID=UPI00093C01BA|nr:hypothetical protein [Micromonospora sp. CB01531]OKI47216.1 hypothetical protein A6A27_10215 [Micromonospora sp. CB01531]